MTSLTLSVGLLFGEGVGESGIIIGLVGEFGVVDSRGSVIPGIGIVSESEVGSSYWLD